MNDQLQTIKFYNQSLVTFEQDGIYYTAMKPICENIGLQWESQYNRIKRDGVLSEAVIVMITPTNGGNQQMICLPIQYLNGWLFGIDTNRVKPEIRETLIKYKKECYQALHDYWFKGKAEREIDTITPEEQRMIQNAVTATHQRTGMSYGEIWSRVKNKFGVAKYEQIKRSEHHSAMIYIASMPIVNKPLLINGRNLEETLAVMVELYGYCLHAYEMQEKLSQHPDLADRIDSEIGGQYLHNLRHPLENAMTKAKRFIRNNSEKLTIIKAVDHLLN
ncbi:phage antirepressor N-terminal domain-containing protein [Gallibacterium genomosp. 3]|uniref:phage antirepressor N-terminal domain-containing protein n=1 Tax=Gallibacterium genomosp. 3 TaxID=505345 RepID=UPI0009F738E8|nr:phage antirepressor N-terminal domain-containing protein [Gallibacterium genomosp. 3]